MKLQGAQTIEDEVRGDDDRQVATRAAGGNELPEVALVQHSPPLVVIVWGVPRVHEHDFDPVTTYAG